MSIEDRVIKLEKDMATVKAYVTNHLPHMIEDVQLDIKALSIKIKPLETKNIKSQGVNEFLNLALKVVGVVGGLTWTTAVIAEKFNWFGLG